MPRHADSSNGKAEQRTSLAVRVLPFIAIGAAAAAIWLSGALDCISLQALAEHREQLRSLVARNSVLAVAGYTGIYAALVAFSLPAAAPLTLAGGFLFGWLVGGLATLVGATVGAVSIFLLARGTLAEPLAKRAGPRIEKLRAGFQDDALSYLLFLRLVPVFPFWLVNLAPALLGVSLKTFVIATFIGIIPGIFAFALTGAGLDHLLAVHHDAYRSCIAKSPSPDSCTFDLDPASLLTPQLLLAFAALGIVALIPVMVKRFRHRKPGQA
jgi:uncharacterized membrane protein YdjX (TVP38/TMEM64 family)